LLARFRGVQYLGEDLVFSDDDQDMLIIAEEKIYEHKVLRVNYTTYDRRREQDSITATHPDVMVLSQETDEVRHPYWYARVIHIFHVNIRYYGEGNNGEALKRFDVLFVRWFGRATHLPSGFAARRLPKVGFLHEDDPDAFGFLDPNDVIRGVHMIPSFRQGTTEELLGPSFVRRESDDDQDWNFYDVNMSVTHLLSCSTYRLVLNTSFVDRDMFMRFRGGGIGHKGSRHWDKFLQSDGAKVRAEDEEDEEEGSDIADEGSDDGEAVQFDEVDEDEEQEGDVEEGEEEENRDLVDQMDNEDPIIPDDDEILDDHILIEEGYGAL